MAAQLLRLRPREKSPAATRPPWRSDRSHAIAEAIPSFRSALRVAAVGVAAQAPNSRPTRSMRI
jgi:hypothetical protein